MSKSTLQEINSYVKNGRNHDNLPYVRANGSIELSLSIAKIPHQHTPVVSYLHLGVTPVIHMT